MEEAAKKEIVLWDHQKQAVEKAIRLIEGQLNCLALFMEVGTGKTPTAVHILRHIYNKHRAIVPTIIFAPPVVLRNWKREMLAHSKIPPERIFVLSGNGVKRLQMLEEAISQHKGNIVVVTNYESVQMEKLFHAFCKWMPKVLICDESHRMKNPTAVRTRKVTLLADTAWYKLLLTGTPVLNDPLDLFAQIRIMDGGRLFGKNFYAFRNQYFYDKNAGMPKAKYFPNFVIKPDSTEKIGRMLESISFQAKKSECLTLPPLVRQRVEVELSKEQAKAYKEMLDEFITFVNDTACVAELAITRTLRLQQILAGYARNEDGKDLPFEGVPRLAALSDLLEDITPSEKVIVWANFAHTYRQIGQVCEDLNLPHVFITGEQNTKQKGESEEAFQKDDSVRVLIAHPEAGGEGVNLTAASSMIYYTRSFSLKHEIQSEARNHRGGSERHEKITRYDIVTPGTIDEIVLQALERKQNVAEAVLAFAKGVEWK